jgi:hypothetical protein
MRVRREVNRTILKAITYVFGGLSLAIYGFVPYNPVFITNVIVLTIALYAGSSIVIGVELKKLWSVLAISSLAVIISDLCFTFLQQSIAIIISLFVLLIIIRYSLIEDHDSGWFGALCAVVIGSVFLVIIEIILVVAQLFLF